jgi:hypothetical protein
VALAGLTLVAAGCGGSSGEGVARVGTTDTTTSGADSQRASSEPSPTAYAACMRSPGIDWRSPAVKAAQHACRHLAESAGSLSSLSPQQLAQLQEQLLAFASCMRSHGVPAFPPRRTKLSRDRQRPGPRERPWYRFRVRSRSDQSERADRDRSDCGVPKQARKK